jgi:hypothetical protein
MTSSISWLSAQSFGDAHRGRVCLRAHCGRVCLLVFIGMSMSTCWASGSVYSCNSKKKLQDRLVSLRNVTDGRCWAMKSIIESSTLWHEAHGPLRSVCSLIYSSWTLSSLCSLDLCFCLSLLLISWSGSIHLTFDSYTPSFPIIFHLYMLDGDTKITRFSFTCF